MKPVKTTDTSYTFFNEEYQEHYHSLSGALEEARKKYAEPLGVKDGDVILDVCFGLGYNSFAALERASGLRIVGLENDAAILKALQKIELPPPYDIIKKVAKDHVYKDQKYSITLLFGDARETIKYVTETFDAVFFDPFSPKKCPWLWTTEFFHEIFIRMKPGAKLGTYSCARMVRKNLQEVGFIVVDGPNVGRYAPSTIAIKPSP